MTAIVASKPLSVASTVPQFADPLPAVPRELKALPQWVMWCPVERDGRNIKMPLSPVHPGAASSTNPAHWSDYETAVAESSTRQPGGLGFVFSADDPYVGIDLDDCRDAATGTFKPWAREILDTLNSYSEISPSGTGVKIWVRATLPGEGKGRRTGVDNGEIEIYSSGRYFTVTGQHVAGTPITVEDRQDKLDEILSGLFAPEVESDGATAAPRGNLLVMPAPGPFDEATELLTTADDDALIRKAMHAENGDKFKRLWEGDWHTYDSQSNADLALCSILAYWSSGDPIQVDRIFRRSALIRDKWDDKRGRQTYGEITLVRACAGQLQRRADAAADDSGLPSLADLMSTREENDAGNAKRFREIFGQDVRYSRPEKKWLVWDGRRWAADAGGKVYQLAKRAMAEFLRQAVAAGDRGAEKFAKGSLDHWRINALLQSAQSDLEVNPSAMDASPWLLNFEDGTFNLQAGTFREHRREDFITKLAHCSYDPEAPAPTFHKVLQHVTGGSAGMLDYLHQVFGYALTGSTAEKAFFVFYGPSGTGKTTLLDAIRRTFEDYSCSVQIETLMAHGRDLSNNQQSDLADLRGARLAQTSEVESGQRLKEGLIKRLTQGTGTIKAARKFQEHIEWRESHKLFIDANHRPEVKDGVGIWERLHCIPFPNVLRPEDQDLRVHERLAGECAGIAAWVVQGALAWIRAGKLAKPREVSTANDEYRVSQDAMGDWIEECCSIDPKASAKSKALLDSFNQHTYAGGGRFIDARKFKERLAARGISPDKRKDGTWYVGIGLGVTQEFSAA